MNLQTNTHTRFVSYELCVRFSYVALDADADAYTWMICV